MGDTATTGDVNSAPGHEFSPLLLAYKSGQPNQVLDLLKQPGISLEDKDPANGQTVLTVAVREQQLEMIKVLLDEYEHTNRVADVNTLDNRRRTPLIWAAISGVNGPIGREIIRILLQHGANPTLKDQDGRDARAYAEDEFTRTLLVTRGRRLIVCCDGTWNDREERQPLTNVTRIQSCLEAVDERDGQRYEQISFYLDGIGTGTTTLGSMKAGATGSGIERKIREAYRFLCLTSANTWDQIVLIGFSRGAYTAQCVAKLVNDIGLIDKERVNIDFPPIFDLWVKGQGSMPLENSQENTDDKSLAGRCQRLFKDKQLRYPVYIDAYAVFDTVKSLGGPRLGKRNDRKGPTQGPFKFVNEELPPNIKNAFQAMALDEQRKYFQVLTLRAPGLERRESERPETPNPEQVLHRFKQCWFLGSHSDIGGGNENNGPANISLCWMISQLKKLVKFDLVSCWGTTGTGSILQIKVKEQNQQIMGMKSYKSLKALWRIFGKTDRMVKKPTPSYLTNEYHSNESVHFSVRAMKVLSGSGRFKCKPLQDYNEIERGDGSYIWVKAGGSEQDAILEDDIDDYQLRMLQRWMDIDHTFVEGINNDDLDRLRRTKMSDDPRSIPFDRIQADNPRSIPISD